MRLSYEISVEKHPAVKKNLKTMAIPISHSKDEKTERGSDLLKVTQQELVIELM